MTDYMFPSNSAESFNILVEIMEYVFSILR